MENKSDAPNLPPDLDSPPVDAGSGVRPDAERRADMYRQPGAHPVQPPTLDVGPLVETGKALLRAIQNDEAMHGGLLTGGTVRAGDELRLVLNRVEKWIKTHGLP